MLDIQLIAVVLQVIMLGMVAYTLVRITKISSADESAEVDSVQPKIDEEEDVLERDLRAIDEANENDVVDFAIAVFDRHPESRKALEKLLSICRPLTSEPHDLLVRREAVIRLKDASEKYLRNCSIDELPLAKEVQTEIDRLADKIMEDVRTQQREGLESQIKQIELKVKVICKNGKISDIALNDIEKIDSVIDKEALRQYEDLQSRYDKTSKELIRSLNQEGKAKNVQDYNLQALKAAKEAFKYFKEENVIFKKEFDIGKLAGLLGGWDQQQLLAATNTYISTVYAEIFQNLKPEDRLDMTEQIIRAEKKPLKD